MGHAAMSHDDAAINAIQQYASEHPDVVVATRVQHDPPATMVLIAGDDLDRHDAALYALVPERKPEIRSGADSRGRVILRNVGETRLDLESEQPLLAVIIDPVTGREVGGGSGFVAGTGLLVRLNRGQEQAVLLLLGTAGLSLDVGYAVPPGHYFVKARLPVIERTEQTVTRRLVPVPMARITCYLNDSSICPPGGF